MSKPRIKIKAWCPALHPKQFPEDMEILQELYEKLYARLEGLEFDLSDASCNKMLITIEAGEDDEADS